MTVISDVKKALEKTFHKEYRRKLHWFLGLRIKKKRIGQSHSRPRMQHKDNNWAVSNGSMQTLKNSSWFEPEFLDSTEGRRRGGPEDQQKLGWITSVSGQTDIMLTVIIPSRQMNAPTKQHWMCGERFLRYLQVSKGLKLSYTKKLIKIYWGESNAKWSGYVNDRKSTTVYQFKLNCAKTQSCTREANTLRQNFTSFGMRWDYFNSLCSYWQYGSRHLQEIPTRIEGENIQNFSDGKRLYSISSSLSGGIIILIKL